LNSRSIRSQRGFTFVELIMAVVLMVLATMVLISHLALSYKQSRSQRDRVFAFMVAKSILAEVQALANGAENSGTNVIDRLDDAISTNPVLTIAESGGVPVLPDHELSGNSERNGKWVWTRQIIVRPLPGLNNRKLRYVSVRVLKQDDRGFEREIANLSSVVNSLAQTYPATQVFDVYFLAIENIPGWWVHMDSIRPFMEAMVTDLERNNPGLSLRTHWITKASYGRNPVYRPFTNNNDDSHQKPKGVYWYPALMPAGNSSTYYYVPSNMNARIWTADGELNGYDSILNPHPYTLADFFNHAMRHPQEQAYHDLRIQAVQDRQAAIDTAIAGGLPPPDPLSDMSEEPTYRLLLEDMCTNPDKYRNALVLNLHGELTPMPSIRNYSDAAKAPAMLPNVRVVTHPEELRTYRKPGDPGASDDVVFRVYAYTTDPDVYTGPQVMPMANQISLEIMGVNLVDPLSTESRLLPEVELKCLQGGVPVAGDTDYSSFLPAKNFFDGPVFGEEMAYMAGWVAPTAGKEGFTRINLFFTPVVAPAVVHSVSGETHGVDNNDSARLYGMEYNPSSPGATDFSQDLAYNGTGPKNTARWTLRIPGTILASNKWRDLSDAPYTPTGDVRLTVRTRIWNAAAPETTGTMWPPAALNQPENLSETYTWWADSIEDVPFTERSQFMGDPRHMPYKDLFKGDPDFPDGYNRFFDSLNNGTWEAEEYPGFEKDWLRNRWNGYLRQDAGRFFELLRTALARSGSIYNTITGWSHYYMGHGAEIGYDAANGYPDSIPVELTAFTGNKGTGFVNNITGSRRYVRSGDTGGKGAGEDPYWWGMPWLGELCPDAVYSSQWLKVGKDGTVQGNLKSGDKGSEFYQEEDNTVYQNSGSITSGTALLNALQRTKNEGCTMFFNTGDSGQTFIHRSSNGDTGDLQGPGLELANNYNMTLPLTTEINRPFSLTSGANPDGWDFKPYDDRYQATLIRTYYNSTVADHTGSGLVELRTPDGANSAYLVVNGLAQTATLGTGTLAKYSLLTLVHSYFESGDTALVNRIQMTPRTELLFPTEITELVNPLSIELKYDIAWKRWDGKKYTEGTSATFFENDGDIEYFLLYSKDNASTWLSLLDDSPVVPASRPTSPALLLPDAGAGPETHSWPTAAAKFPRGTYHIRVEAYRRNQSLHYSYHQKRIFIDR